MEMIPRFEKKGNVFNAIFILMQRFNFTDWMRSEQGVNEGQFVI